LALKIVSVEKQRHSGMLLEKEKELLLPADTDQRSLVPLSGHPLKLNQTPQLSTLQLNQRFSNAIHFTISLLLWHLKSASHVFDVIVIRDTFIHLGKM